MFGPTVVAFFVSCLLGSSSALPILRREVPQGMYPHTTRTQSVAYMSDVAEHSHEDILRAVRTTLALNNPQQIQDPVFGLLGNAAAAAGAGKITVSVFVSVLFSHSDTFHRTSTACRCSPLTRHSPTPRLLVMSRYDSFTTVFYMRHDADSSPRR